MEVESIRDVWRDVVPRVRYDDRRRVWPSDENGKPKTRSPPQTVPKWEQVQVGVESVWNTRSEGPLLPWKSRKNEEVEYSRSIQELDTNQECSIRD